MKIRYKRDGFSITAFVLIGPLVIGLVTTIIVQSFRGAHRHGVVQKPPSSDLGAGR